MGSGYGRQTAAPQPAVGYPGIREIAQQMGLR